ncbi:hypothetical protein FGW37_25205 [Streptomyces rectiverticillatus]|uniref:hypothetical protein n=1 Tax=Streptomyces rectiverticillatus TaxID=173860 RepID=UPI0015C3AC07|nr:hypothetical protein [Streptomyces rectiverticillatus]QLE74455.1 hypothetical protein FGW37_25205 [Streptomyces rectiverticillatus]
MRNLARAALVVLCAAGAALPIVPVAQAASSSAPADCRYFFTSGRPGPNGETRGSGVYDEGDRDGDGRVCRNGWWVRPHEVHHHHDDDHGDDGHRWDGHRDDRRWDDGRRDDSHHRGDQHRDDDRRDDHRHDHDDRHDHDHSHGRRP